MGDAKRRKELGLMPQVATLPFTLNRGEAPHFEGEADEDTLELMRRHIYYRLGDTPGAWDREYRRAALIDATKEVTTREELNRIPTPQQVRGRVTLVRNKQGAPSPDALQVVGRPGEWLRLEDLEASFDGQQWQPRREHVDGITLMMAGHRALQEEEGEPSEVFFEISRDGQVTFSGDYAAQLSEAAQEGLREELSYWYGVTPEDWDRAYREYAGYAANLSKEESAALPTPRARRGSALLYPDYVILPPFYLTSFVVPGHQVMVNLEDETVTFDGESWQPLAGQDDDDEGAGEG